MKLYAELESQLHGMPRKGDVLVDSGSNIRLLTTPSGTEESTQYEHDRIGHQRCP